MKILTCLALTALPFLLVSCDKGDPVQATEKTCTELGDSLAAAAGGATAVYRVVRPNGGESYRVGDTLRVRATGNINAANASLYLQVGSKLVRPASLNGNLNVYTDCDMAFVIPDSLQTTFSPVMMISMMSDSVRIRVENYTDNTHRDVSDGVFQIRARVAP